MCEIGGMYDGSMEKNVQVDSYFLDINHFSMVTCKIEYCWRKGTPPVGMCWYYPFRCETYGYIWQKHLKRMLKGTIYEYCCLDIVLDRLGRDAQLTVSSYLKGFMKHPEVEYAIKAGLINAALEVIFEQITEQQLQEFKELSLTSREIQLARKFDLGAGAMVQLHWLRGVCDKDLERYFSMDGSKKVCLRDLGKIFKYVTPTKFMNYVEKYGFSLNNNFINEYLAYLRMARSLREIGCEIRYTPCNLRKAKGELYNATNAYTRQMYDKKLKKIRDRLNDTIGYGDSMYVVVFPESVEDFIKESAELKHCVQGYVSNVVAEKKYVAFVRDINNREKPLCTVAIQDGKIVEKGMYGNANPNVSIQRFLG